MDEVVTLEKFLLFIYENIFVVMEHELNLN